MWESQRDFQGGWEGWEARFLAFHAFHTLSFPWPAFSSAHGRDIGPGPRHFPSLPLCHYGEQNGDAMRDPEVCFELEI